MEKTNVTFKSVVNATFRVDNSDDTERLFDISADANVIGSRIDNFQNGVAIRLNNQSAVCTFSENDSPYLTISFNGMGNADGYAEALNAVCRFITDARDAVPTLGIGDA